MRLGGLRSLCNFKVEGPVIVITISFLVIRRVVRSASEKVKLRKNVGRIDWKSNWILDFAKLLVFLNENFGIIYEQTSGVAKFSNLVRHFP